MSKYAQATEDELDRLRHMATRVNAIKPEPPRPKEIKPKEVNGKQGPFKPLKDEAYKIPSPLHLILTIAPELKPHSWQAEILLQLGGYLNPKDQTARAYPNLNDPFRLCLPAANGSGKDQFIIAGFAVWFAMAGLYNRVIVTSSSHEQLKYQTEPYIRVLVQKANRVFGKIFDSISFFHVCTSTGGEIKLFATDDPGHAEGYHPYVGGQMAVVINEAKTVQEPIWEALSKCTGYSYWLEISSPGSRSGHFYNSSLKAITYPDRPVLGKYYLRRISAYDCPHIPSSHIDEMRESMTAQWFASSVEALFTDFGDNVVIPLDIYEAARNVQATGSDIGIGLDLAAGGDENACYVRSGNKLIYEFHFVQVNTEVTAALIDKHLSRWKDNEYSFNADDGGVGRGIIDKLVSLGWQITRRLNQAAPRNKREFLNTGAELWFHVRRLFEKKFVPAPFHDQKLKEQLTTRYYDQLSGGKFRLEDKKEARSRTHCSPDRGDAYVLCYYSFKREYEKAEKVKPSPVAYITPEWIQKYEWGKVPLEAEHNFRKTMLIDI